MQCLKVQTKEKEMNMHKYDYLDLKKNNPSAHIIFLIVTVEK